MKFNCSGFTLIELSIVLVIIGLLVGGVLAGQDLIRAAQVRATIAQIEKYNLAANTFRGKYGYLPGDMTPAAAAQFGFVSRSGCAGDGDGNGLIESAGGSNFDAANLPGCLTSGAYGNGSFGETALFWSELTYANGKNVNLIEGNFSEPMTFYLGTVPTSLMMPEAKLGNGLYINIWSGDGVDCCGAFGSQNPATMQNYFYIAAIGSTNGNTVSSNPNSAPTIPVRTAYMIDAKMDDGLPQTGNVLAMYSGVNQQTSWSNGADGNANSTNYYTGTGATPTAPSSSTCYDNNGSAGVMHYSVGYNNGAGLNCGISFRFQ
jgi:prepilin-type N-terminal cleavage/methylation domain-containing protein